MRSRLLSVLLVLSSCAASLPPAGEQEDSPDPYPDVLARLESRRVTLAARHRAAASAPQRTAILGSARSAVFTAITEEILPAWYGTPWDFNGTSQTPGEGMIACGYLVSTVLRDAGFKLERVRLAQQASENIVRTFAPPGVIRRYRDVEQAEAAKRIRKDYADGLYVVGMDYHVGFLVLDGERVDLCHSAYVPPASVACEPAETSPGFYSRLWVVGPALPDARVKDWLEANTIPTVKR